MELGPNPDLSPSHISDLFLTQDGLPVHTTDTVLLSSNNSKHLLDAY